ncbi:MAG TPA: histidine triad nucleotide-binding protein [Thermoanaerobaculia bacterium]|nr:histidine triad nucleotide-binding protein [Thermoanaerobaculia bacterium]
MTSPSERCLFCRIVNGEIPARKVDEDSETFAFEDINPQAPTHILVIPKRHIASLDELTDGDDATIGRTIRTAARIAHDRHLDADGYRVVINCGEAAGQTVFHIHIHLLGGRSFSWPPG